MAEERKRTRGDVRAQATLWAVEKRNGLVEDARDVFGEDAAIALGYLARLLAADGRRS